MIESVDINHAQEIDEFVKNHPKCHFEQTSSWGLVKNYDNWTGLICRDENKKIKGVMCLLHSKINHTKYFRLYAPRGPIFDENDSETFKELINAARKIADETNAIVLKIDPMIYETNKEFLALTKEMGFTVNTATDFSLSNPRVSYVTDIRGLTQEELMSKYHRTLRTHIRGSERKGVTLRMGTVEDLPRFYEMMSQTGGKNGFRPHSLKYYENYITKLEGAGFYIAEENGETVAATMTAELGNRMWYMYGCSDQSRLQNHPNEFLQWKMQCHAIEMGYDWFDLRGVEGFPEESNPKYGLHRYKQSLGAEFQVYCGEFYLVFKPLIYKSVNLLHKIL